MRGQRGKGVAEPARGLRGDGEHTEGGRGKAAVDKFDGRLIQQGGNL